MKFIENHPIGSFLVKEKPLILKNYGSSEYKNFLYNVKFNDDPSTNYVIMSLNTIFKYKEIVTENNYYEILN
jgi:hypothetical protein